MNLHICKANLVVAILLVNGLFFSNYSLGNPGVLRPTTYVLAAHQYPETLKKHNPSQIYIVGTGMYYSSAKWMEKFIKNDTIINLKGFIDSTRGGVKAYRLIFKNTISIDSVWQFDNEFQLTDQAYVLNNTLMKIVTYDSKKVIDKFILNYGQKIKESNVPNRSLSSLLRLNQVYNASDRNKYSIGSVWVLSIGIDKYSGALMYLTNCKSDAQSYSTFFKEQLDKVVGNEISETLYNEYTLLDSGATKEKIINALKEIAAKSSANDYFILNYNGHSFPLVLDSSSNKVTYFFPYQKKGYKRELFGNSSKHKDLIEEINHDLISINVLQEYIQIIPANNQLFISETGTEEKFKTEFVKTLMRNSPTVASLLNKNRIIIFPNRIGMDAVGCNGETIRKGPINYYITSLDTTYNIYDIFRDDSKAAKIAFSIKDKEYTCKSFPYDYFDIFFEKKFLQDYKEIFGDGESDTRGMKVKPKELQQTLTNLTAKKYALVVGTDNYKGKGWNKLSNPIKDARAVADELSNSYGFDVQLLEDKPMDSIYKAIREYYRIAQPNDQLVVYFAGHGDVDNELLDDGFIVCTDSRSIDDDPVRNTYIPYAKLQKMLNNIPARQVLVLLDVCHGGTFDAKAFDNAKRETTTTNINNKNVLQFLKDKLPLRTRKFLSSVGSEPAFDGKAGRHSPFANLLLQVLRAKGEGSNGIVTLGDINAVLQTASLNETATLKISPHMADFGNTDAFSEFIFIPTKEK